METIEYKGCTITIEQDIDVNPRTDYDHFGKMICWHNRSNIGDNHTWEIADFKSFLQTQKDNIVALPLYLYEHSGQTISTTPFECPWDSGQVGWIYMEQINLQREFNGNRELAERSLQGEVKEYDTYLRGDVWSYDIVETGDSCGGMYGYDYCLKEAKAQIDRHFYDIEVDAARD